MRPQRGFLSRGRGRTGTHDTATTSRHHALTLTEAGNRSGPTQQYTTLLVDPDPARDGEDAFPDLDGSTDVVVTDHHRPELGEVLRDALAGRSRWIGVLGKPRHPGPHVEALAALGLPDSDVARVHRPIGLNIGSRTPPEIAGLIAERAGRPGGFDF